LKSVESLQFPPNFFHFFIISEGQPTLFLLVFLGVEKCIKRRKGLEKQEKLVKVGKFLAFSRKISVNFSFFLKFPTFSCFSSRFLAFLYPRKSVKKESVAPRPPQLHLSDVSMYL